MARHGRRALVRPAAAARFLRARHVWVPRSERAFRLCWRLLAPLDLRWPRTRGRALVALYLAFLVAAFVVAEVFVGLMALGRALH